MVPQHLVHSGDVVPRARAAGCASIMEESSVPPMGQGDVDGCCTPLYRMDSPAQRGNRSEIIGSAPAGYPVEVFLKDDKLEEG